MRRANNNLQDADDLAFSPGDIIEIVDQTNADWWTGKVHGKQGLFPSAYVEKLPAAAAGLGNSPVPETKPYRPFGAAYHGVNTPPPPGQGVNNVGLQEAPGTEAKKDKFGKYKSTVSDCEYLHLSANSVQAGSFRRWRCWFRCRWADTPFILI